MERYALNKNKEGYSDLTACKAIKKADKTLNKVKLSESAEQKLLVEWANLQSCKYSELKMLVHVPNEGKRSPRTGAELKRMGLKAGFPDLGLLVPRQNKHGLFIEMKVGRNKCTDSQKEWIRALMQQGYEVKVCYSCEEAIQTIKKYLGI